MQGIVAAAVPEVTEHDHEVLPGLQDASAHSEKVCQPDDEVTVARYVREIPRIIAVASYQAVADPLTAHLVVGLLVENPPVRRAGNNEVNGVGRQITDESTRVAKLDQLSSLGSVAFATSVLSRCSASSANRWLSSMPMPSRYSSAQALSVEPTPTKGSRTVIPRLVNRRTRRATSVKENGAGCSRSICVSAWSAPSPFCVHTLTLSLIHSRALRSLSWLRGETSGRWCCARSPPAAVNDGTGSPTMSGSRRALVVTKHPIRLSAGGRDQSWLQTIEAAPSGRRRRARAQLSGYQASKRSVMRESFTMPRGERDGWC